MEPKDAVKTAWTDELGDEKRSPGFNLSADGIPEEPTHG